MSRASRACGAGSRSKHQSIVRGCLLGHCHYAERLGLGHSELLADRLRGLPLAGAKRPVDHSNPDGLREEPLPGFMSKLAANLVERSCAKVDRLPEIRVESRRAVPVRPPVRCQPSRSWKPKRRSCFGSRCQSFAILTRRSR